MLEGDDAATAVAAAGRRTISRRDLTRHRDFAEVSPEVGVLDPDAFADAYEDHPDEALALLADLHSATDEALRAVARELAAQVVIDLARPAHASAAGVGRIRTRPIDGSAGDLDLDASIDAVLAARTTATPPDRDGLHVRTWTRPSTAYCLLVDRSGSMLGERLATAAVAAAAVVLRVDEPATGGAASVVAFSDEAVVVASPLDPRSASAVVSDLLRLRGFGVTDLGLALRTARAQLDRCSADRRVTILLSDCRVTSGGEAVADARALDELVILAPAGDTADAELLADTVGAAWTELAGPTEAPAALERVLGTGR